MKSNKLLSNENMWKLAAAGSAMLAGTLVRSLVTKGWKTVTKKNPPVNPASKDTNWQEALTWTIATSVAVGVGQLIARRGTDALWINAFGNTPAKRNATVAGW